MKKTSLLHRTYLVDFDVHFSFQSSRTLKMCGNPTVSIRQPIIVLQSPAYTFFHPMNNSLSQLNVTIGLCPLACASASGLIL